MSKYVKNLMIDNLSDRLQGVSDALLVNVVGLDGTKTSRLRKQLREKNIHLLVVKNSLAKHATQGTSLASAFSGVDGTLAMVWGGEDFISLAKEIVALHKGDEYPAFQARGGVMDGEHLSADRVQDVSKWPNRQEQLSLLLGQILSPGARLLSQINAPGGLLASQIEKKAKAAESEDEPAAEAASGESPLPEAPAAAEAASGESPLPEAPTAEGAASGESPLPEAPAAAEAASGESPLPEAPAAAEAASGESPLPEPPAAEGAASGESPLPEPPAAAEA